RLAQVPGFDVQDLVPLPGDAVPDRHSIGRHGFPQIQVRQRPDGRPGRPPLYSSSVRYIGNKTRLLGFIRSVLRDRGIGLGIAIASFSGTASVASALTRWGFRVAAGDLMECAYVFGRAYVQAAAEPRFDDLAAELDGFPPTLAGVIALLN